MRRAILALCTVVAIVAWHLPARAADIETWEKSFNTGLEAESRGDLPAAVKAFQASATAAEKLASKDPWPIVVSLNKLASVYRAQSDLRRAEQSYKKALGYVDGGLFGTKNPLATAATLNGLASLYQGQGKFKDAEEFYKRAIDIDDKLLDQNDPRRAQNLLGIGDLYLAFGQIPKAADFYLRSLRILEKVLGANHRDLVDTLGQIAGVAFTNDQLGQANRLYRRALAIQEKTLGAEHCDLRRTLMSYAGILRAGGSDDDAEAEQLEKRAESLEQKCGGGG